MSDIKDELTGESSPRLSSKESSEDEGAIKSGRIYRCSRCGQRKAKHICGAIPIKIEVRNVESQTDLVVTGCPRMILQYISRVSQSQSQLVPTNRPSQLVKSNSEMHDLSEGPPAKRVCFPGDVELSFDKNIFDDDVIEEWDELLGAGKASSTDSV